MQASVPDLTDLSSETKNTLTLTLRRTGNPPDGGFARNCLLAAAWPSAACGSAAHARGWDQHGSLPQQIRGQCKGRRPTRRCPHPRSHNNAAARGHARHLGRRIRTHRLHQCALTVTTTAATPRPLFTMFAAGGGIKPASSMARQTTTATTSRKTRSTFTTSMQPS